MDDSPVIMICGSCGWPTDASGIVEMYRSKLCRAREAANTWVPGWGVEDFQMAVAAALSSSSSPCPHEARVKELEEKLQADHEVCMAAMTVANDSESRIAALEKVAEWADKLEISMHRVDRDGNPQYDAWALSSLRAALDALKEG